MPEEISKRIWRKVCVALAALVLTACVAVSVHASEISVASADAVSGKSVELPVVVDKAEKMAGVKLVMTYDSDLLSFKKASKTDKTSSLLHVVNDKQPGKVIVVMAGAKGIDGEKLSILTLSFDVKAGLEKETRTEIKITGAEMVAESLSNIDCDLKAGVLTIAPEKSEDK